MKLAAPPNDGLPIAEVGPWACDKLRLIEMYVKISAKTRRKYTDRTEATYIDLWCGPGASKIKGTRDYLLGSPVVAYQASVDSGVPFNRLFVSDLRSDLVDAAHQRLEQRGATVHPMVKAADEAVHEVVARVNPYGLHFAMLDPFSLDLPFTVIQTLAQLKRVDLLMLLSTGDLQRNFRKDYLDPADPRLERLAPGVRKTVNLHAPVSDEAIRQTVINYWFSLLKSLKFATPPQMYRARNSKNVTMYWLVFASRSGTATDFWEKAMKYLAQPDLGF